VEVDVDVELKDEEKVEDVEVVQEVVVKNQDVVEKVVEDVDKFFYLA
tara:strand:- start:1227 stop:1367 length:141 start_codon:yes stop_codon:yes gene_type:complete